MLDFLLIPSWKRAFVYSVDGMAVPTGQSGWNADLTIGAGLHTVTVAYDHLGFGAKADMPLTISPGANYVVKFDASSSISYARGDQYVDLWIADGHSGQPVTSSVHTDFRVSPDAVDYSEEQDSPDQYVDFEGAQHSRPPFHPGGPEKPGGGDGHNPPSGHPGGPGGGGTHTPPPPHSGDGGGPPSIPNTPRPSPGGGGGHTGGGGGSSSGHSGGGSGGGGSSGGHAGSGGSGSGGDHKKG